MADSHLQVNHDGSLETRKTVLWATSESDKKDVLLSIFSQPNWDIDRLEHIEGAYWKLETHNQNISYKINLYVSSVRDEARKSDEYKMQLGAITPIVEEGWKTLIMGIYTISHGTTPNEYILSAYNKDRFTFSTNPSIRGTRTIGLQKAKILGFYKTDISYLFRPEFIYYYLQNQELLNNDVRDSDEVNEIFTGRPDKELQQIYYGAPGTGKSHTINKETKGHETFRTTFHPDSDYSTFVGAYKPVMEEVETRVVPVVLNNGTIFDQNNGTLKEKKISYKFVKQAFMKAYIAAWRTFANNSNVTITSQTPSPISLPYNNQTWILTEVADDRVLYTKEDVVSVEEYKKNVLAYWPMMPEFDDKGKIQIGTVEHYQAAGCTWYKKIHGKDHSADECWEAIWNVLEAGGAIEATPNSQTYSISLRDDQIAAVTRDNKAYKSTIKGCYENADADSSVQKRIAKELKEFNANDFDKAWEELKRRVNGVETPESTNTTEIPPVFLIIEEINRGNCAQIFGDLFQLLDRKEGFSQYPIHADDDIRKCLVSEHTDKDPSFGTNGLEFSDEQKTLINSILDCEDDVAEKIARGEVLVLPSNLYIWATMNTSDQSLFPIDSAFKRRWDWRYVKITNGKKDWKIEGNGYSCDWWTFVQEVNKKIASATRSDDKKLGYFFCKAMQGQASIDENTFVGKVIFYLWNDVFKDNDYTIFKVKDSSEDPTFDDFYMEEEYGKIVPDSSSVKQFLINVVGKENMTIDNNVPQEQEQESSTLQIEK